MYFNCTLLFTVALCAASALASLVPLEARTLEDRRLRVACVSNGETCTSSRQCCGSLTCTNRREIANRDTTGELKYVVSDAAGPAPLGDRKLTFCQVLDIILILHGALEH